MEVHAMQDAYYRDIEVTKMLLISLRAQLKRHVLCTLQHPIVHDQQDTTVELASMFHQLNLR